MQAPERWWAERTKCRPNVGGWSPGNARFEACIAQLGPHTTPKSVGAAAWFLNWSPDGTKLALLTAPERADRNYSPTGGPRLVTWCVYYVDSGELKTLFQFEPSESCRDAMSHFDQWNPSMSPWSPDGRFLLANARDRGGESIWMVDTTGENPPRRLVEGSYAVWSWR